MSDKNVLCNGENLLKTISRHEEKLNKFHGKCADKIEVVKTQKSKIADFKKLIAKHNPKLKEIFDLKKELKMANDNLASGTGDQPSVAQTKEWLEILEQQSLELEDIKRDGGLDLVEDIVKRQSALDDMDCVHLLNMLATYKANLERAEVGEGSILWMKEHLLKEMKPKLVKRETMVNHMAEVEHLMDAIMRALENCIKREKCHKTVKKP